MKQQIFFEEESVSHPAGIPHPSRQTNVFRSAGRICLFAIAFLAPFFFLPITTDSVGINKLMIVSFLAVAGFVCFLGCIFEERKLEYPRSWFFFFLILFVVACALSSFLSVVPSVSWYGYLSQPDSFLSVATYAVIFFLAFFFFRHKDIRNVGILLSAGVLLASAAGFLQAAGILHGQNLVGSAIQWGILMVAGVAAFAGADPGELRRGRKWFFFIFAAIAAVVLFLLNYQLLWLAVAVFTIALAALRFEPKQQFRYAFIVIVLALFFTLIGPRLPVFAGVPSDARPGITATGAVVEGALQGWRILIGSGPATFSLDYAAFRPLSINGTSFWNTPFTQGYDFVLTLFATGGLLGFIIFMAMAAIIGKWFLDVQFLDTDHAMVLSAAAFLLLALFFYPASFAELAVLFLLLGLFVADASRREISFVNASRGMAFTISILVMVVAAVSLAVLYGEGQQYTAAVLFGQSTRLAASGSTDAALQKVDEAINLVPSDEYFRSASGMFLAKAQQVVSTPNLAPTVADAVQAAQSAAALNPWNPANWGNLGSVYEAVMPAASGADVLAEQSYQKAAALDPVDPEWDLAIGRVFVEAANLLPSGASANAIRETDWTQAETFFEKALSLKDDYADPRIALINLYIQEGNTAQAIGRIQELAQQNPLDPGVAFELGYLYYQNNQTDQAQQEFQVAVILDPAYANARYYLGMIYAQKGMTAQALAQFHAVQAFNPGNQDIENAIQNLEVGQPIFLSGSSSTASSSGHELSVPGTVK